MRWPRFTLLQLFLFTALIGLLAGWWTQSRRVSLRSTLRGVELSPDGKRLAASYLWGNIDVWDLSGSQPRTIANHRQSSDAIIGLKFLNDRSIVLHQWRGNRVEIVAWNLETGRQRVAVQKQGYGTAFDVSLDGNIVATADAMSAVGATATIEVWDLKSGKPIRQLNVSQLDWSSPLALDERGSLLVALDSDRTSWQLINTQTGKKVGELPRGRYSQSWSLSSDGSTLAAVMWPGATNRRTSLKPSYYVEIFDLGKPDAQPRTIELAEFPMSIQLSQDGARLLVKNFRSAALWDSVAGQELCKYEFPRATNFYPHYLPSAEHQRLMSADGKIVALPTERGEIQILDAATGQRLLTVGGTHQLRDTILYCAAFIGWAVAWGLVSRREKLRQPATTPTPVMPTFGFRLRTQRRTLVLALVLIVILCGLLAWLLNGIVGNWLNVRPGVGLFLAIFFTVLFSIFGYMYLKMRLWPLRASLRIAQSIVGNTGRRQRQGKVTGFFAGESTIEHTYLKHIDEIRQKLSDILGRDLQIKSKLLVIGLERTHDYYLLNRTRLSHGGIVMTHLFAEECRVCEELAHRDGTTATVMLRATLALALLRRHWRIDAPVWLSAVVSAYLAADEHRPATLRRAHRMLLGILGDDALTMSREFLSMPLMERYKQIFQKDDPAILRELTLSQAIAVSLGEFLLGDRGGAQRDKMLEVIRSVGRKGNIDEALQRVFGHNAAGLIGPWWEWVQRQPLAPWEPPPEEARWAIAELTRSIGPASSLPLVEQQRNVTVLGAVCDLAAVPTLLAILESPQHPLRAEAFWALRGISGEHWEDDPPRWRTWWQEVEPQMGAASTADRPPIAAQWTGGPWSDDIVKAELATAIQAAENPAADQPHEPWQLPAARALMGAGGVWGIVFTVAVSFYSGTIVMIPTLGIALLIGLLATSRAAGRHWWGLRTAAGLQIAAIVGCDPLQSVAGIAGAALLRTSAVRRYLQRVGGS